MVRDNPKAFWQEIEAKKPAGAITTNEQWQSHLGTLLRAELETAEQQGSAGFHTVPSVQRSACGSELTKSFPAADVELGISGLRKGAATPGV